VNDSELEALVERLTGEILATVIKPPVVLRPFIRAEVTRALNAFAPNVLGQIMRHGFGEPSLKSTAIVYDPGKLELDPNQVPYRSTFMRSWLPGLGVRMERGTS
jgi:hypothetical protein